MKNTYIIPESRREEVEKLVSRYQRKAAKYGANLTAEFGAPYATKVNVVRNDHITHTTGVANTVMVEVFDLTIDGDEIRKDGYEVIAKIEHMDNGNMVAPFGTENKLEWAHLDCNCEHCNIRRFRAVTFIVRHKGGDEKQVGSTCLKDYCGIDPHGIGYGKQLREIVEGEDVRFDNEDGHKGGRVYDTAAGLALALKVVKENGYVPTSKPNSNAGIIATHISDMLTPDEYAAGKKLAESIAAMDEEEAFSASLNNVRVMAQGGYFKDNHFGYIAYAPVAYERYEERMAKKAASPAESAAEAATSKYVGEVGKRIETDITSAKLLTTMETQWGVTFLYKFVDTAGNVLVWFASSPIELDGISRIKGTVKTHNERDGVKQTILTRCKVA